ncbi:helicase HerA domain-containing protein [Actinophytocola sediminis]
MSTEQRQALAAVRINSAETPDDVWRTPPSHVDGLHTRVEYRIRAGVQDAKESAGASPIGLALQGQKGVGKTHLLGWTRRVVQQEGGYFFLIELSTGDAFWADTSLAMRSELLRTNDDGELQLTMMLRRMCEQADVPDPVAKAIVGDVPLTPDDLDSFVGAVRRVDARVGRECGDTIRALVLYAAPDEKRSDVGRDFLAGQHEENRHGGRRTWSIHADSRSHQALVTDMSRVLALTGPSVLAVDQLDSLVSMATNTIDEQVTDPVLARELALIADGLMHLRERTRRSLSIVACLPNTWKMLHSVATDTVMDRFTEAPILGSIVDPGIGKALVEKWLGVIYQRIGFVPPSPTWPVAAGAFAEPWNARTPRELLRRIHVHAESCLHGRIRELASFDERVTDTPVSTGPEPTYFSEFDSRFAELREKVDILTARLNKNDEKVMPALLLAGLKSWINEVGNDDIAWDVEHSIGERSHLHARLRRTLDEKRDIVERWAFRFIACGHGNYVLNQMRFAGDAAGIRPGVGDRRLVLLSNGDGGWQGAKTKSEFAELAQAGSQRVQISDDDLRTFSALKEMFGTETFQLLEWVVARKPASRTTFLRAILPDPAHATANHQETRPPPDHLLLGLHGEVRIALESLRKHVMIFAGSGSGKTVLLRRIVEECALRGVSAIVLDPNNDLARLGDAWPDPPAGWRAGDAPLAAEYLANTEVLVWTPGRASGRPLSFHPLPDFAGVLADEEEFTAAVEAAVAALVPHARLSGTTKTALRGRAVLREAMTHYARTGERDLSGFVDVLAHLPEGVSTLTTATTMAADLAETLRAAMVNDPLLGGNGAPADPAALLTPTPGRRARISVISFVGLSADDQRQAFVSQLQLEVFAWIKANPAADRPLGGLFVLDEAQTIAPSGSWTASTQSTILLASQARKYGLGLVLATQAPKGVHNQVSGNATTQFFGRLNSPAQIAAANDLARAKGATVEDISQLDRGQFYVTGDSYGFTRMSAPLCLSHHPPSPLRLEEVLDRARSS